MKRVRKVAIVRDGLRGIIVSAGAAWDDFLKAAGVDLGGRMQPPVRQRERW